MIVQTTKKKNHRVFRAIASLIMLVRIVLEKKKKEATEQNYVFSRKKKLREHED